MDEHIQPDKLDIAEKILLDAADAIRRASQQHGHTYRSFSLIAEMWTSYMIHVFTRTGEAKLRPHDVAQMQAMVKQARSVYGRSNDNFVDQAGYTSLAAMLIDGIPEDDQLPVTNIIVEENARTAIIEPNS